MIGHMGGNDEESYARSFARSSAMAAEAAVVASTVNIELDGEALSSEGRASTGGQALLNDEMTNEVNNLVRKRLVAQAGGRCLNSHKHPSAWHPQSSAST